MKTLILTLGSARVHRPTNVAQGGEGGDGPPPLEVWVCWSIPKRFYLHWKALFYEWRCCWGACDVTINGRHLGCHQGLEIRVKQREMVIFFA